MNPTGELIQTGDWVYRLRLPEGGGPFPVIMLLHGWTGDENSMWLFNSRLPRRSLLILPRGLYTSPLGGYGWQAHSASPDSWVDEFSSASESLLTLLSPQYLPQADLTDVSLAGFSQGAALAFTFALFHPSRVKRVAGLASFLPQGAEALARSRPLVGKPIFVAHGSRDEIIPIEHAYETARILTEAGAKVTLCQDDVGHKLSADCFKGLGAFFSQT